MARTICRQSTSGGTRSSLCSSDNRFRIGVTRRGHADRTSSGPAVPCTNDSGTFWFFSESNIEFLVKVIDGCTFNDAYWTHAAPTTNVEHTMTITDTPRGGTKTYTNVLGNASPAITDSAALATCP